MKEDDRLMGRVASAKSSMIKCLREKFDMEQNLSGCDWCCGGGDEALGKLLLEYDKAREFLESKGVAFDPGPKLCITCSYHDREPDEYYCKLCDKQEEAR